MGKCPTKLANSGLRVKLWGQLGPLFRTGCHGAKCREHSDASSWLQGIFGHRAGHRLDLDPASFSTLKLVVDNFVGLPLITTISNPAIRWETPFMTQKITRRWRLQAEEVPHLPGSQFGERQHVFPTACAPVEANCEPGANGKGQRISTSKSRVTAGFTTVHLGYYIYPLVT